MKLETLITYAFRIHINLWVRSFWRDWLSFVNVWVKCEIMCESFMGNVMLEERCVVTCHKINGLHANSSSIVDIHLIWTISSYKRNFSIDSCFLTMYTLREYKLSWIPKTDLFWLFDFIVLFHRIFKIHLKFMDWLQ